MLTARMIPDPWLRVDICRTIISDISEYQGDLGNLAANRLGLGQPG